MIYRLLSPITRCRTTTVQTHCTRETNLVEDGDLRDAGASAAQCVEACVLAEHSARVRTVAAVHNMTVAAGHALNGVGRMSQHLESL